MSEPNMQDVFDLYQSKVALLSSAQRERLLSIRDEGGMTPFVMGCAILRAKQEQRRSRARGGRDKHISFNYIYRIMQDWLNHGITTEERFSAYWAAVSQDENGKEAGGAVALKLKKKNQAGRFHVHKTKSGSKSLHFPG